MNVFIVSKAGENIASRSLEWLKYNKFFKSTNFLEKNVHFCKERKDKGPICNN